MSQQKKTTEIAAFLKTIGPGLITGASDDDPSGIVTYSQAGAQFGLMTLWSALVTFPLMLSIQEMCARIGLVTGNGLTRTLQKHYSPFMLFFIIFFTLPAILLNISANIAGMGAVAHMLVPGVTSYVFSTFFTLLMLIALIFLSYKKMVRVLKYLCSSLLLYIIIPFLIKTDWIFVLKATFAPTLSFTKDYLSVLVALLGTTISPYLFFWQTTMEAEKNKADIKQVYVGRHELHEMKRDVTMGMFFSNLIMFFIILTTGIVLFPNGIHHIESVEQAAKALEPLAGKYSYLLFATGIIGTGFLAIPVLCGCLSYILSTALHCSAGLNKKYYQAKYFYSIIALSLFIGLGLNAIDFSPIKALFYTAILYGITAPILIGLILHISNNKKIMGKHTNGILSNIGGALTLLFMSLAVVLLFYCSL